MKYRSLGKSGLEVSQVGFGGWALGGGWGTQDDAESVAALHRAIDLGLNFIDTAEGYGRSERVIGKVLKDCSQKVYVATKTPPQQGLWPPSPYCRAEERYGEKYLRANVEERLKNLGTDCIDLLQLHTWTRAWNRDPQPFEVLRKLREEGKIRLIGLSTPEQDQNAVIDLMREGYLDVVQVIYNIFEQEPVAELLPVAKETGTGVIARVVFDEGILTGKYRKGHRFAADDFRSDYFEGDRLDRGLDRVEKVRSDIAEAGLDKEYSMADVALKFVLAQDAVSTVIPGIRNPQQAELNISAADKPDLPEDFLVKLRRHNWLRAFWYFGK
jgi:aryl-alcohol dehydrogenase-like predicted oxidoreductase